MNTQSTKARDFKAKLHNKNLNKVNPEEKDGKPGSAFSEQIHPTKSPQTVTLLHAIKQEKGITEEIRLFFVIKMRFYSYMREKIP